MKYNTIKAIIIISHIYIRLGRGEDRWVTKFNTIRHLNVHIMMAVDTYIFSSGYVIIYYILNYF